MAKYRNTKVEVDGIKFDSKAEAKRWHELLLLVRVGEVTALQRQVRYELAPSVKFAGAPRAKPALVFIADFRYLDVNGHYVVEDCKGVRTTAYTIKKHLMKSVHGIDIKEIGRRR